MEPDAKRQKRQAAEVEYHRFPGEIRNMLYKCTALPEDAEKVERSYSTVDDGNIKASDAVQEFYVDHVRLNGKSELFDKDITKVASIAEELLSLVTPWILFVFDTPRSLETFAEAFAARAEVCTTPPIVHVEVDFGVSFKEIDRKLFASWAASDLPHGRDVNAHGVFENWMMAFKQLPSSAEIHLVFPYFWRDFRSLRGLSKKTGLHERSISFRFPTDMGYETLPDHNLFTALTIGAVKGIEVVEQTGISEEKRTMLVEHGCTGFNLGRRPIGDSKR